MAKVEVKVEKEKPLAERSPLFALARKALLAGMGAAALTQEQTEKFVSRLVERGEIAQKDGAKLIRDVAEKRKKAAEKAESELDKRIEDILGRMNVPTKADIEALSARIAALTKKVDELKKG